MDQSSGLLIAGIVTGIAVAGDLIRKRK